MHIQSFFEIVWHLIDAICFCLRHAVNALWLEKPLPVKSWSGKRDATQFGPQCLQGRGAIPAVRLCNFHVYIFQIN